MVKSVAKPPLDAAGRGFAYAINHMGEAVDHTADSMLHASEQLEAVADRALHPGHHIAGQIQEVAEGLTAWADEADPASTSVSAKQIAHARVSGKALSAVADGMRRAYDQPDAHEVVRRGGALPFEVDHEHVSVKGHLIHGGAHGAAVVVKFAGRALSWALGSDTLRHTGINFSGGLRASFLTHNQNIGLNADILFPSVAMAEEKGGTFDAMYLNYSTTLNTPVMGVGWSRRGKATSGLNLFFLRAYYTANTESVFVGVPGFFGVTFGRDIQRGPYGTIALGIPLVGLPQLGAYAYNQYTVYSPWFAPVNAVFTRPIAKVVAKVSETIIDNATHIFVDMRRSKAEREWRNFVDPRIRSTGWAHRQLRRRGLVIAKPDAPASTADAPEGAPEPRSRPRGRSRDP